MILVVAHGTQAAHDRPCMTCPSCSLPVRGRRIIQQCGPHAWRPATTASQLAAAGACSRLQNRRVAGSRTIRAASCLRSTTQRLGPRSLGPTCERTALSCWQGRHKDRHAGGTGHGDRAGHAWRYSRMLCAVSRKKLHATASYTAANSSVSNTATKSPVTMSMLPPPPRMSCLGTASGTRTSRSWPHVGTDFAVRNARQPRGPPRLESGQSRRSRSRGGFMGDGRCTFVWRAVQTDQARSRAGFGGEPSLSTV